MPKHKTLNIEKFLIETTLPVLVFLMLFLFVSPAKAQEGLDINSETSVSPSGEVRIVLNLKNISGQTLYSIHPMFHFHHTMEMGTMIKQLPAGESVKISTDRHPPVLLAGRYPLVVLLRYRTDNDENILQTYTGSFHHKEALESVIDGEMEFEQEGEDARLKIHLNNHSNSMKNVRLMLILPPGLEADKFPGMMTLTLHSGEEVYFETDVQQNKSFQSLNGYYPIHLLLEYGEFLKHYTSEIQSNAYFNARFNLNRHWPHLFAMILFASGMLLFYRKRTINYKIKI